MTDLIPVESLGERILVIRNQKVMLDHDLAKLYGVPTKRLNEQVKRNIKRFPTDFIFSLTSEEKEKVVAICDHLKNLKYSPTLPYAFTEHGAVMAATILNTEIAINVSVQVVRAFIRFREYAITHADLARKVNAMEKNYDAKFKVVFDALRQLMTPSSTTKRKIGF